MQDDGGWWTGARAWMRLAGWRAEIRSVVVAEGLLMYLRWGISPASLPAFLSAAGYRPIEQSALPELRARFLDPIGLHEEPLAPYEHLCLAETVAAAPRP